MNSDGIVKVSTALNKLQEHTKDIGSQESKKACETICKAVESLAKYIGKEIEKSAKRREKEC